MDDETANPPILFAYPSQIPDFERMGLVRGRDYMVYRCLACFKDMDQCKCPPEVESDDEQDREE